MIEEWYSVYITTNVVNGKSYCGIHKESKYPKIDNYLGSGKLLKRAVEKYGKENFIREIKVLCSNKAFAYQIERWMVTEAYCKDPTNYNLRGGGYGSIFISDETRHNMSVSQTGKKQSSDTIAKRVAKNTGKKRTTESKQRSAAGQIKRYKAQPVSAETRVKMSESNLGNTNKRGAILTDEQRQNCGKHNIGRSPWNKGKKLSVEHRGNLSKAHMKSV